MVERLHYITQGNIPGLSHSALAQEACRNGVKWVQLRMKGATYEEYLAEAVKTLKICRAHGAKLIINDNVTIAKAIGADGVHLGKEDMDPLEARKILGKDLIIGGTSNTLEDIIALSEKQVDYVGLGPFRFTTTKEKLSPVLGIEGYRSIMKALKLSGINLPVIAIGGIGPEDIRSIMDTGVNGVALASVVNKAKDKRLVIQNILKELDHGKVTHRR